MIRQPPISTLFPSPPLFRSPRAVPVRIVGDRRHAGERGVEGRHLRGDARRVDPPHAARLRDDDEVAAEDARRSEEHTSELQSRQYLVCRLLLEKKKHTNLKY